MNKVWFLSFPFEKLLNNFSHLNPCNGRETQDSNLGRLSQILWVFNTSGLK